MWKDDIEYYENTKVFKNGIKDESVLLKLNGFDLCSQVPVDPFHCISGVIRNRLHLMIGTNSNSIKTKQQERLDGRFPHFWDISVFN